MWFHIAEVILIHWSCLTRLIFICRSHLSACAKLSRFRHCIANMKSRRSIDATHIHTSIQNRINIRKKKCSSVAEILLKLRDLTLCRIKSSELNTLECHRIRLVSREFYFDAPNHRRERLKIRNRWSETAALDCDVDWHHSFRWCICAGSKGRRSPHYEHPNPWLSQSLQRCVPSSRRAVSGQWTSHTLFASDCKTTQ